MLLILLNKKTVTFLSLFSRDFNGGNNRIGILLYIRPGLERGEQGQSCEFNVWTREAGAGSLSISVEGPSKAHIDFKDRKDGSCYVVYNVTEPGKSN